VITSEALQAAGISEDDERFRPDCNVDNQPIEFLLAHPEVGTDETRDTTAPSHPDPMSV
jgi:hypothetical protein